MIFSLSLRNFMGGETETVEREKMNANEISSTKGFMVGDAIRHGHLCGRNRLSLSIDDVFKSTGMGKTNAMADDTGGAEGFPR